MHVADFGAGSGHYTLAMAQVLHGHHGAVYAIDVQKDLLRRINNEAQRRHLRGVHIIWGDLEKAGGSKIANGHCDLVLISNLLFQVENKDAVLKEARRVVKPLGRVAIIDWADSFGGMGPIKKDVVTVDEALALARKGGFEFIREFRAGAHHYGLVLKPV